MGAASVSPVLSENETMKRFFARRPYLLFLLPGFALYTLFVTFPIVYSIPISLTEWSGLGDKTFVGLDNFVRLFTHPAFSEGFWNALSHNAQYFFLMSVVAVPICLFLAYLMFNRIPGHNTLQVIIFLPNFITVVALGLLVTMFFDANIGLVNQVFRWLGIDGTAFNQFYAEPRFSVPLVFVVSLWRGVGYSMLLFLASLKLIPNELLEASTIDGASEVQKVFHIYIPMIMPTLINILILSYIWSLTAFEIPFVLGGAEGGVGRSMDFLTILFYRTAFSQSTANGVGMGTAIAVVTFFILLIGTVVQFRLFILRRAQEVQ
jgi:ABC-type sugar transport system permease subunit